VLEVRAEMVEAVTVEVTSPLSLRD